MAVGVGKYRNYTSFIPSTANMLTEEQFLSVKPSWEAENEKRQRIMSERDVATEAWYSAYAFRLRNMKHKPMLEWLKNNRRPNFPNDIEMLKKDTEELRRLGREGV